MIVTICRNAVVDFRHDTCKINYAKMTARNFNRPAHSASLPFWQSADSFAKTLRKPAQDKPCRKVQSVAGKVQSVAGWVQSVAGWMQEVAVYLQDAAMLSQVSAARLSNLAMQVRSINYGMLPIAVKASFIAGGQSTAAIGMQSTSLLLQKLKILKQQVTVQTLCLAFWTQNVAHDFKEFVMLPFDYLPAGRQGAQGDSLPIN